MLSPLQRSRKPLQVIVCRVPLLGLLGLHGTIAQTPAMLLLTYLQRMQPVAKTSPQSLERENLSKKCSPSAVCNMQSDGDAWCAYRQGRNAYRFSSALGKGVLLLVTGSIYLKSKTLHAQESNLQ